MTRDINRIKVVLVERKRTNSLEVKPTRELEQQILSFGSDIEILYPKTFREQIGEKIKENYKKYFFYTQQRHYNFALEF